MNKWKHGTNLEPAKDGYKVEITSQRWLESGIVRRNKNIDSWPNLERIVESQDNDDFNDKKLK